MTSTIRYKFLCSLYLIAISQKQNKNTENDEGFTLVELIVAIAIIAILATIVISSGISAANRARQVLAQNDVGILNRAQISYLSTEGRFAPSLDELASGVPDATNNYIYNTQIVGTGSDQYALSTATPQPDQRAIGGVAGKVLLRQNSVGNLETISIICTGDTGVVPDMASVNSPADCP